MRRSRAAVVPSTPPRPTRPSILALAEITVENALKRKARRGRESEIPKTSHRHRHMSGRDNHLLDEGQKGQERARRPSALLSRYPEGS